MVAAAHRADDRCPARNDQRLSQGRRHRGAGPWTPRITSETGHFHRRGVHRLWWSNPAISEAVSTDSAPAKAATKAEVSTDSIPLQRPSRAPSASACEPYRELIAEALGRGRNAMAIWQDLVDDHGFTARYASVRRFVVTLRGTSSAEARVVITTAPGEEAQVDYGDGPMVRHPETGKYRRTRLFVLTLGYSRKAVRLLVWQSSTQIWAGLHERAFRRLGGTVRVIVLDNLKEGVLTPDIYDRAQSPVPRRARALRRRRIAVPRRRSRSQGQSRSRRRPRQEDAVTRPPLRIAGGGAGVSRSLGSPLGRHARPRHYEASGRRHVC
jgi:transposase